MSFFERQKSPLPILFVDATKRYDVYCFIPNEVRLYENVKFVAHRTLDDISNMTTTIGTLVEIEGDDGTLIMLPKSHIHMVCEHGTQPKYKTLEKWTESGNRRGGGIGL